MNGKDNLPSYSAPPVVEVVASVQFEPLPAASVVHFGLLWQRFRNRFPKTEQKPPLAPVIERLGVRPSGNRLGIELIDDTVAPRVWFINEKGDELIQVQSDRFIRNWRAVSTLGNHYPRYQECIRPRLFEDYEIFRKFLDEEQLGNIEVTQCEITYVNHINRCDVWSSHSDLGKVFRPWRQEYSAIVGSEPESINVSTSHILKDDSGAFLGRLHINLQSAFRAPTPSSETDEPIFALAFTARGRPTSKGVDGVFGFFDVGRKAIVHTFDMITTEQMHRIWGKQNGS